MKKFLLATAAVLASTSAYAADYAVVHPFYTPAQGKFVSTTELEYERSLTPDKAFDAKELESSVTLTEGVKYGVTDDIQVGIEIGRDWGKDKWKSNTGLGGVAADHTYTNSWELTAGYNIINDGKAFLNTSLTYGQTVLKLKGFDDDVHAKIIGLEIFGGYNFDAVTVFGSIDYTRQIDGEKENLFLLRTGEKAKIYSLEAGVFKAFNDQISAKASLSADIDETKDAKERTYWLNLGADYSISKKMAVGVDFGYMIDNDKDATPLWTPPATHSAYKLGVDFTVEF